MDYASMTDAQLEVAARYVSAGNAAALKAEQARRQGSGDGSKERVADLIAGNTAKTRAAGKRALRSQR